MQSEVVKQSDLLNQVVLDRASMQELGQIEVMWMYPKVHRVLGFICKSGWLGSRKTAFNLDQLDTIGSNSVLVNSKPVETDAEKVRQLESLVNCEVWTDAGDRVGKIVDYLFDLETGEIQHYLYVSSGWEGITGSVYLLPPNYILNFGNRRVLVPEGAVSAFAIYPAGIQEKFSKVTDLLKDEKSQVKQEVKSVVQKARSIAEQATERARAIAEQFVEEIDFDEPQPTTRAETSSDEPDPWDDWEVDPEPPKRSEPTQTSAQPPKQSPSDAWDDDDSWI